MPAAPSPSPSPPSSPSTAEFATLAEPFRRELLAHCYRMLGSMHDAEDLVQETYLRAWRGFDRFEGRSSVRRWLYKIATRACLTALESRSKRPLPSGLGAPDEDYRSVTMHREPYVHWLEPMPDAVFAGSGGTGGAAAGFGSASDTAAVVAQRSTVRLAFIAALQLLSARQRAVLTLRDVLAFSTAEVAELLDTTNAAVDSSLRRARARLVEAGPVQEDLAEPGERAQRALLDSYVKAFTNADADALVHLLRVDVELEMPPYPKWFTGRDTVIGFIADRILRPNLWHMIATSANGQPAVAVYRQSSNPQNEHVYEAYGVHVLTLIGSRIARITAFLDPSILEVFGLAATVKR